MATRKQTVKKQPIQQANPEPVKPNGLITVKVVRPVEGRKIGDVFETTEYAVRFQLKHKSIVKV